MRYVSGKTLNMGRIASLKGLVSIIQRTNHRITFFNFNMLHLSGMLNCNSPILT